MTGWSSHYLLALALGLLVGTVFSTGAGVAARTLGVPAAIVLVIIGATCMTLLRQWLWARAKRRLAATLPAGAPSASAKPIPGQPTPAQRARAELARRLTTTSMAYYLTIGLGLVVGFEITDLLTDPPVSPGGPRLP